MILSYRKHRIAGRLEHAMSKIPVELTTSEQETSESFYYYVLARHIAPYFTLFFKKIGVKNPNVLTLVSFFLMLIVGAMILYLEALSKVYYRIIIALLVQLSFILDCSDGQLARITRRKSKFGAWLDRLLDRVGEFTIFLVCGLVAWYQTDQILFVFLGLITGYGLTAFTIAMSLADSCMFDNITKINEMQKGEQKEDADGKGDSQKSEKKKITLILSRVFFFLNFGIGERYLYVSVFLLLNRLDIMLYVSSFLVILRVLGISHYMRNILKKTDLSLRRYNES